MYFLLASGMKFGGLGSIGLYLLFGVEVVDVVRFDEICEDEDDDRERLPEADDDVDVEDDVEVVRVLWGRWGLGVVVAFEDMVSKYATMFVIELFSLLRRFFGVGISSFS